MINMFLKHMHIHVFPSQRTRNKPHTQNAVIALA